MEGSLSWGGEHTIKYTDNILQNCIPETYIILLTNATPNKFNGKIDMETTWCIGIGTYTVVQSETNIIQ